MKKKNFLSGFMAAAAIVVALGMVSCDKGNGDDGSGGQNDGTTGEPVASNELRGKITGEKKLNASTTYLITGPVIVESGGVLDIPAGTTIKAEEGFSSYILVLQGGKIHVRGTAEKPVRMTAELANARAGAWGGLIINGKAPLSGNTTGSTEINTSYPYGGTVADDNSGSLEYLILEYTGARASADVEHNGLTLNGVGSGTKIENIYIPNGADDGIEFFGGSVNVKNLLVVNTDDDMFDFTQGYNGTLENAYGIWEAGFSSTEADPRGIEADGNLDGKFSGHSGQSAFTVKNVTFDLRLAYAAPEDKATKSMQDVIKVRRGAKATITNALVTGTGWVQDMIDFSDGSGPGDAASAISLTNNLTTPADREINPATGYPGAVIESGNTGCSTAVFSWTNYQF